MHRSFSVAGVNAALQVDATTPQVGACGTHAKRGAKGEEAHPLSPEWRNLLTERRSVSKFRHDRRCLTAIAVPMNVRSITHNQLSAMSMAKLLETGVATYETPYRRSSPIENDHAIS